MSRRSQFIKGDIMKSKQVDPDSDEDNDEGAGSPELSRPLDVVNENLFDQVEDRYAELDNDHALMQNHLYEYLQDIRERVLKEFDIDYEKWSEILAEFVIKAINTVKPSSFGF